ncbi:ATP adenylyltransferase [Suhomyces tanzawaensis NRRL Y-17324]|uniref:ATP adenylyltransferase n=1 Tax=Suhomyces tanzawaensis NRRL Y-17324 TaxID=984487 RepID=A0A1E4SDY8_9ASCO|nr:ATP adenylyltransferase [Suhomyces tanzawaensis NRRL Y-17324]ODV77676.1 ATP adenylyltransferase [Suhomyces tanzawaensis NRRL Y-17324]
MFYELPTDFEERLQTKFTSAVNDKHIEFNVEQASNSLDTKKLGNTTVEFQLTLLESLTQRPEKGTKEENPFAKPEPELTVIEDFGADNDLRIVFNKFPVVPMHFMVITKEFKSQNSPLSTSELAATYSVLHKLKDSNKKWFAFYNCGPESGASQPHKHIQFMSLPSGFSPYAQGIALGSSPFIPNVKEEPLQNADLGFAHFVARLPDYASGLEEEDLTMYFASLLQRTLTVLRENDSSHISYNFILTTEYMMLVPRSSGKFQDLGINSCGFMGLVLCKNEQLLNMVQDTGPEVILQLCAFPTTAGLGSDEYHY